jgi:hypothetical protein
MDGCRNEALTGTTSGQFANLIARGMMLRDQICQCADAACANKLLHDMTEWSRTAVNDTQSQPRSEATKRAADLAMEMIDCMNKRTGSRSSAPPAP